MTEAPQPPAPGRRRHSELRSRTVQAGGLLFLAAIRGYEPETRALDPDTRVQARHAFDTLKSILAEAGATLEDVVKVTVYLHDVAYNEPLMEVWGEYFTQHQPARVIVQVANANPSVRPEDYQAHFALDVIASAPR